MLVFCASQLHSSDLISLHFIHSKESPVRFYTTNDSKHVYNPSKLNDAPLSERWGLKPQFFFSFKSVQLQLIDVLIVFPGKYQGYIGSLERSDLVCMYNSV